MKEAPCAGCGAPLIFSTPGILLAICEFCRTSNFRRDVSVESLGKVAERTPLASQFQLGTQGRYRERPFTVRGLLQLDHGLGLWNEWAAETDDGWIWIAEAQGEILVFEDRTEEARQRLVPPPDHLAAGQEVDLPWEGQWIPYLVTETGTGRLVTVSGQLPIRVAVGQQTRYADLARGSRSVATLEAAPGRPFELLSGERVELGELALDPASRPEHRPERVSARSIDCAQCGAGLEILDPEHALRIGCSHCGALLEPTAAGAVVIAAQESLRKRRPALPLGAAGVLLGEPVRILGLLERSVQVDHVSYPWREYLLRTPAGAYRWLVESDGHFLFGRPISPAAVQTYGAGVRHAGLQFAHFNSGQARVDHVWGEFYWDVAVGECADTMDFVAPPRMISLESTPTSRHATLSQHVTEADVRAAFDHRGALPARRGVGAVEPNPHVRIGGWWTICGIALAGLIVLRVILGAGMADQEVLRRQFGPVPVAETERLVQLSEEFELPNRGSVEVGLGAEGLAHGWLGVDASLVNVETGDVVAFALEAEHYSGYSDGEFWTEGSRFDSVLLGTVPKGRYLLRLDPIGFEGGCKQNFEVWVRRDVPRTWPIFVAFLVLPLFPILAITRKRRFEKQRWENSDHPWS